jgi:two-component system response regulator HupR/HoxA
MKDKILIVDDQVEILNSLRRLLNRDYEIFTALGGKEGLDILRDQDVAVILSDQRMPEMDGVTFLNESIALRPNAVRLMITGYADIEATIGAVNKGNIYQYITKPFEPDELKKILSDAVQKYKTAREKEQLQQQLLEKNKELADTNLQLAKQVEEQLQIGNFIGNSPPMLRVLKLVKKVVNTPTTVLILGETGTGKEMLAKIIHFNSNRKLGMFVAQNCGAIPDTLLQSELFGHVKGSFTGAIKDKKGLFEEADKGTIFLDEIGDTSPALQLGLLRVLQEGEIKPVGSNETRKVDVRVIAATNRDLLNEVKEGRFREDLYYRLSVFPIVLPPLRDRKEDIPDLVHFFLDKYAKRIGKNIKNVDNRTFEILNKFSFPGNIRELENEIERMVTLADDNSTLTADLLSPRLKETDYSNMFVDNDGSNLKEAVEKLEIKMITRALNKTHGNILKAAKDLGISRVGLHKMLKRYEISAEPFKS